MNIFILDQDPKIAAEYHCDKHVNKMIIESLQILGSTHWHLNGIQQKKQIVALGESALDMWKNFPRIVDDKIKPYGIGFVNHPSTKWTRESKENLEWLISMTHGLLDQYAIRYKKESASRKTLEWFEKNIPSPASSKLTPFYQALPEAIQDEDPVHAYRLYYASWKEYFAKWKTGVPPWWKEYLEITVEKGLMSDKVKERYEAGIHQLNIV
jgi:hypothetical protein